MIAPSCPIFSKMSTHFAWFEQPVCLRYMQRAKLADLFIDTPLVNAHTSATDVLWAGVPMVTLPRSAMISRVAASILIANGMPHLVARNIEVPPPLPLPLRIHRLRALGFIDVSRASFSFRTTSAWLLRSRVGWGRRDALLLVRALRRRAPGKTAACSTLM